MARSHIFSGTREFDQRITDLLDLLYPLIVGLWNLRVEVSGYLVQRPAATEPELQARFLTGTDIHGSGLRPFMTHPWEEQQAGLGTFALFAVVALFEGWAEKLTSSLGPAKREKAAKALQWPPQASSPMQLPPPGVDRAIAYFTSSRPRHAAGMEALADVSRRHWSYQPDRLPALLTVYRAFKERRNALAHGGGRASDFCVLWDAAAAEITAGDLGLRFSLRLGTLKVGAKVVVDPRQVSGLIRVLLQAAATIDTLASSSRVAEEHVVGRFPRDRVRAKPVTRGGPALRSHLRNLLRDVGLPAPSMMDDVTAMLQAELSL